jgi:hypothetical protein
MNECRTLGLCSSKLAPCNANSLLTQSTMSSSNSSSTKRKANAKSRAQSHKTASIKSIAKRKSSSAAEQDSKHDIIEKKLDIFTDNVSSDSSKKAKTTQAKLSIKLEYCKS